jgi:hypothetical protein
MSYAWNQRPMDLDASDMDLHTLPIKELLRKCREAGIDIAGLSDKSDLVDALEASQNAQSAELPEALPADDTGAAEEEGDEEEELMRQALLMSTETEDALRALPVRELRARLEARGILTRGLTEKADLVAALRGGAAVAPSDAGGGGAPAGLGTGADPASRSEDVQVLLTFRQRVRLLPAAVAGRPHLEGSGKVVVPQSLLGALAFVLGGELPRTLLLRLSHRESSVCVGIDEFVDDSEISAAASAAGCSLGAESAQFGGSPPNALAAAVVPRWVLGSLGCVSGELALVSLISLPRATYVCLQPQANQFAEALGATANPRQTLTELVNRFVAVSVGDTIQLQLGGERHALDVLALRGLPKERCGLPTVGLDVQAALRSLDSKPWKCPSCTLVNAAASRLCEACGAACPADAAGGRDGGGFAGHVGQPVRCACLVDVDLEVELAPSVQAQGERERAEHAAAEAARLGSEKAAQAQAEADAASARLQAAAEERRSRREAAAWQLDNFRTPHRAAAEEAGLATCAVRLPNGARCELRLGPSDPLLALWWLVEAEYSEAGGEVLLPTDFGLSTGFPRRSLRRPGSADEAFESAGLGPGQHMFMVETRAGSAQADAEGGT